MMAFRSATVEENDRTGLSQSKGNQRAPWRLDYPCMAPAGSTSALAIAHPVGEFRHRGMDFGACLGVGLLSFGIQKTLSCRSNRSVARCLFRVRSCNGVVRAVHESRATVQCRLSWSLILEQEKERECHSNWREKPGHWRDRDHYGCRRTPSCYLALPVKAGRCTDQALHTSSCPGGYS